MDYVIGVDLGGTYIRAILTNHTGHIYKHVRLLTEATCGPHAVIDRIVDCIQQLVAHIPPQGQVLGVGIGSPGPLDPFEGVVLAAPNLPGWKNIPLRAVVAERTGLSVELWNDANVAALGEWHFGGGIGRRHMVYITVSTGIGAGVIMDGQLLLGRAGAGTELGHTIIDIHGYRTWEDLASGTALAAAAAEAMARETHTFLHTIAQGRSVSAADVALAAAQGDAIAIQLMQREAELLGIGLVNTLHLFSPEIILMGGSVVMANPFLLEGAQRVVHERVLADIYRDVPIELAHLGDQVGVLGAAALILHKHQRITTKA